MAVVTRNTAGYPQSTPLGFGSLSGASLEARANVRSITFNIAATNGDSIGSRYNLGRIPSTSMTSRQCRFIRLKS